MSWKGSIGLKIKEKVQMNIVKDETLFISPFVNGLFGVFIRKTFLNVNIIKNAYIHKAWHMKGILCEHACVVILLRGQNVGIDP